MPNVTGPVPDDGTPGSSRAVADDVARLAKSQTLGQAIDTYEEAFNDMRGDPVYLARLGRVDLFYLMVYLMNRADMVHNWLYERTREVEASPNGHLDLWAREHYKSTIITWGQTTQDILSSHGDDPLPKWNGIEITVGIFSHTRPNSKKFLRQIKQEFENNTRLIALYPDVLWTNPRKEADKWSEEMGISVRRRSNPKEATVEAWGLVDGQPTGAHFFLRVYDDVVTRESVNTPEQIQKTTDSWELSSNLGVAEGGLERYIGTRYAIMDTYHDMMQRGSAKPRIYPATDDGTETGNPVFLSKAANDKKRIDQGPTTYAAQMLQRPISKATATFAIEHLRFIEIRPKTVNIYILGDPAHSKRRGSDRTGMPVLAVDAQRNIYLVDGYNHKMNLTERWDALRGLRTKWKAQPGVQNVYVGYERYGLQADLEHFELEMKRTEDAFEIVELAWPKEGPGAKGDRIQRMRPMFERGHFFLPLLGKRGGELCFYVVENGEVSFKKAERSTALMERVHRAGEGHRILRPIQRKDEEGRLYDLTERFIVEYLAHPALGATDDLIDAASRIFDMEFIPPIVVNDRDLEPEAYAE